MDTKNTDAAIEQSRWKDYLTDFTNRNQHRPARLEILGDEIGASEEARHLPFVAASFEEKGSASGDALITLGGTGGGVDEVTHTVNQVVSVTPQTGDDGREAALEIAGAQEKAILIFEQPLQLEAETSGKS